MENALIRALHWILWIIPLLVLLFVLYRGAGKNTTARELDSGRIEFARSLKYLLANLLALVVLSIYNAQAAVGVFQRSHKTSIDFVNGAFFALFALLFLSSLFSFPGTIVLDAEGIRQIRWLLKDKHILWEEIVEIKTGKKDRTVTITGANGTEIIHSDQLPDRTRLLLEIKRRCGENLPADFPREPLST